MPKAAPGSRVSASLNTPGAEGVGEDGLLGGQTEGEAALEAVGELDSKFEEWHLQAKHDAAEAKAASARARRGMEGGGGVGRGVFYTGLSRESVDIPYLRHPYWRASSTYIAQVEGGVEKLQLPNKKVIKAVGGSRL